MVAGNKTVQNKQNSPMTLTLNCGVFFLSFKILLLIGPRVFKKPELSL